MLPASAKSRRSATLARTLADAPKLVGAIRLSDRKAALVRVHRSSIDYHAYGEGNVVPWRHVRRDLEGDFLDPHHPFRIVRGDQRHPAVVDADDQPLQRFRSPSGGAHL